MSTKPSAGRVRATYEFIKTHRDKYSVQMMCRVLGVASSGYYEWLQQPISNRAQEDARLLRLIRASFIASQGVYGAPRVFLDLREAGETCSKHRVTRLMRLNNLRALHGYRTRRWSVGKPSVLIPNILQRQFTVTRPNKAWVTDITYIRTWQGWLYLSVAMGLLLVQLGRDAGRKAEPQLFARWGGMPSTRMLSHEHSTLNPHTLRAIHDRLRTLRPDLTIPADLEAERADPDAARAAYESCADTLREMNRQSTEYPLVFEENVNYGFRRNLWAMRPAGFAVSLMGLVSSNAALGADWLSAHTISPFPVTYALASGLLLVWWVLRIGPDWVALPAHAYAQRLLESCLRRESR